MKKSEMKTISIKGKDYVTVSERLNFFSETYPNGSIRTELLSPTDSQIIFMKATVIPDVSSPDRIFIGHSQATWGDGNVNKTSALENCETSAVGRALGLMGIGIINSVASADEINKATSDPRANAIIQSTMSKESKAQGLSWKQVSPKIEERDDGLPF